jgi:D-alanyl-D-alanine carboxypeptidase (penicillin-binding protein 5/6)
VGIALVRYPSTKERKRPMRRGAHLVRDKHVKMAVVLVFMVFLLALGSAGLASAGAQEKAAGGVPAAGSSGAPPEGAAAGDDPGTQVPEVAVQSWALMDAETGLYLNGEDPDEQLPIGSVTKIMTALVVLEEEPDLDEEVTISDEAESYVGTVYSNVGLISGERVTVRDLLVAALIPSGTDAAYALAEHVGGGSVGNFVEMMNDRASSLGLENTNFETPAGLDTNENYSSSRDLAVLTREALEYPLFAETVDTADTTISTQNREIEIATTNQLLGRYPPVTVVKNGTTPQAGANIVASAEANDESLIAVVIGAEDSDERFRAAETILEYGFSNYDREALVGREEVYDEAPLPYRPEEFVALAATRDVNGLVDSNSDVERRITVQEELPPSASAGEELGEVEVLVDGQRVGESPLVAQEGYEEASLWRKASYTVGRFLSSAWESVTGLFG